MTDAIEQVIIVEVLDPSRTVVEIKGRTEVIEVVDNLRVEVVGGVPGPPGGGGSGGSVELYDSNTPPVSPTYPYLRVVRDGAGDPQTIYLGTAT